MSARTYRPKHYRPARISRAESAELAEYAAITAGRYPCDWPGCTDRARERFAGEKLCRTHTTQAMATAYAMEIGGAH